jgi:hypothetical protein
MTSALRGRLVAPLLVVAGALLFGLGAGGLGTVDGRLEAAVRQPAPPRQDQPWFDGRRDVRDPRERPHRERF